MNDTFDFDAAMAEIEPLIDQQQQLDREEMVHTLTDTRTVIEKH